jgi:hypothetical protein
MAPARAWIATGEAKGLVARRRLGLATLTGQVGRDELPSWPWRRSIGEPLVPRPSSWLLRRVGKGFLLGTVAGLLWGLCAIPRRGRVVLREAR